MHKDCPAPQTRPRLLLTPYADSAHVTRNELLLMRPYQLWSASVVQDSVFGPTALICPRVPSGPCVTFLRRVLLGLLWAATASQTSLVWGDLDSWRSADQEYCELSLSGG